MMLCTSALLFSQGRGLVLAVSIVCTTPAATRPLHMHEWQVAALQAGMHRAMCAANGSPRAPSFISFFCFRQALCQGISTRFASGFTQEGWLAFNEAEAAY